MHRDRDSSGRAFLSAAAAPGRRSLVRRAQTTTETNTSPTMLAIMPSSRGWATDPVGGIGGAASWLDGSNTGECSRRTRAAAGTHVDGARRLRSAGVGANLRSGVGQ